MISLRRAPASVAALALTLALGACSTFRASRRLDMTPFAENTTTMVGEFLRHSRPPSWIYLKAYQGHPAVEAVREAARPLQDLMRGVALYSLQVSALSDSRLPQRRQAEELARYLVEVVRPGVVAGHAAAVGIDPAELDRIIEEIRSRETLLEAIAAAQPLVNAVVVSAHRHFELVESRADAATEALDAVIEEKFAPLTRNVAELERLQMRTLRTFTLLSRLRLRDRSALVGLRESDPALGELLSARDRSRPAELDAAVVRVAAQLERIRAARDQLGPELALYLAHRRELEQLRTGVEEELRWGRSALGLWARSHKNLGAGVPVPPAVDVLGLLRAASGVAKDVPKP